MNNQVYIQEHYITFAQLKYAFLESLMYLKQELDWSKEGVDSFIVAVLMGAMHGQSKGFLSLSMPNTFSMGWGYIKKYKKKRV